MGKRGADSYITNVDAPGSEDEEEPGAMVKADAGVIAGRKIAKGGRKKRNSSKETATFGGFSFGGGGGGGSAAPDSIFGGSPGTDGAASATASSIFGGGNGGSATADASAIFGAAPSGDATSLFGATAPSDGQTPLLFGVPASSPAASTSQEKPLQLGNTTAPAGFGMVAGGGVGVAPTPSDAQAARIKALNTEFKAVVDKELQKLEVVNLSGPVQKYLAHYKNIIASTSSTNVNGGGMAAVTSGSSVADAAVEKDAGGGGGSGGGGGTVAAEEEGVHYQARSNLMYIQHTIGEGDDAPVLHLDTDIDSRKSEDGYKNKWKKRGGPLLSIKETNGVMSLVLKGEGESSKLLFMNLALSAGMKATMKREGKKDITFIAVPNPPLHLKCVVCGTAHSNVKVDTKCAHDCFSATGCNSEGGEDKDAPKLVKGQKPKAQPLRLRFKNGVIADEFLAKVNE